MTSCHAFTRIWLVMSVDFFGAVINKLQQILALGLGQGGQTLIIENEHINFVYLRQPFAETALAVYPFHFFP